MAFVAKISNEEVSALEAVHFDGRIVVVDNAAALAKACKELSQHALIGFDTETRPSFKAGVTNKVALLQLSTRECCYLIRLNKLPLSRDIMAIECGYIILDICTDFQNLIARQYC